MRSSDRSGSRWRGWRWILRGALGFVAIVALAIGASVLAVHTSWGRELLRAQVEKQLAATFVGGATVGGIEGSPFGKLTLRDLVINGPDREPAISVKRVAVELGLLPLVSHQARVLGVLAEGVDIDLKRDPDGQLAIKRLTRPGPPSAWSIALPRVEIRNAHVRIDTGTERMNLDIVALDGWLKLPHGGPVDAGVNLRGAWRERTAAAVALQAVVHADDHGVAVPFLTLRAGEVSVIGNGVTVQLAQTGPDRAPAIGGTVLVDATAVAVARLIPSIHLPADVLLSITAAPVPGQRSTQLQVAGRIDRTPIRFTGTADLQGQHARGELATGALDVTKLSDGRIVGTAAATIGFDVRPGGPRALPVATATIRGWGEIAGVPRTALDIAVSSAGERARAVIHATGADLDARLVTGIHTVGERFAIEDATLHVTATDPAHASGGKAPVHGTLRVDLQASGAVRPAPSIAVVGTVEGRNLRMQDLRVAALHLAVNARQLPNRPYGRGHVQLVDLVRGDMQLGELTVDATDRADGKIAVAMRSRPKQSPWLIDADALVTPPAGAGAGHVAIELVRHHVRAGGGSDWTGHTGHLDIGPERIALRDLTSTSTVGNLAVAGSYERAGRRLGDLTANIDAKSLSLDNIAGTGKYHGKIDTHVAVERRRGVWQGEVQLDGHDLSLDSRTTLVDAHVHAALERQRLTVAADASSNGLGSAKLALDADAPLAVTEPAAWKRLGREAIRTAALTLRGVELRRAAELAGLVGDYAGRINGDIQITPTTTSGRIEARDLVAPALRGIAVTAVLDLSQTSPTQLMPKLTVTAQDMGTLVAQADLEAPERLFDLAAWKRLGRGALHGATLRAEDIAIDPAMLDRFGYTSELRARAGVAIEIGAAARTVQAVVDVGQLRGGPIAQPLDIHVTAAVDDRATTTTLTIATKGGQLVELTGRLPVSLAELLDRRSNPGELRDTRLAATAKLTSTDAARLLAVFGRSEITGGKIDGSVELAGTLGAPTLTARLVGTKLTVPPGPRGKPVRTVEQITVTGGWDGTTAKLDIDGTESEGGTLKLAAVVAPDRLRDGTLTVKATKFDLVPLLVFAPGPAGGSAGTLDADLRFTGLDLRTAQIAGELHLREARIPTAPTVGTLRSARIDAVIADHEIQLGIDGKLGAGSATVKGSIALDGAAPNGGKAKITLRKVSPIGTIEPEISADISATLTRDRDQWRAALVVDHGDIDVPKDRGEKLKPVGAPTDMTFASGKRLTRRPMLREEPVDPIFLVTVDLHSTMVESEEFRGLIRGRIELRADGDAIAIYGGIEADRGDLDLFGRRYYVERAGVHFDGPLDPLLDVRITYDFPDVTTITEVRGRASAPELVMMSDPGTYSQGQLLGFLLGGEPGGDPRSGSMSSQVAGAGESYVANQLGGYVKKALPIDVDVLRYEAATSSSSSAVTVGTWVTHSLFVAYRQHLESRPDENTGEGEIEYWLSRRVVIEGTAGNRGYEGVDVLWRKRY